ncbi:MAG: J domain-containing protein [Halobacteria archaeon]
MTETYYDVLGVSRNASEKEIKKAFRRKIKKYHPDTTDLEQDKARKKFLEVKRAKNVLTDPEERNRYDRLGHSKYTSGGSGKNKRKEWSDPHKRRKKRESSSHRDSDKDRDSDRKRRRENEWRDYKKNQSDNRNTDRKRRRKNEWRKYKRDQSTHRNEYTVHKDQPPHDDVVFESNRWFRLLKSAFITFIVGIAVLTVIEHTQPGDFRQMNPFNVFLGSIVILTVVRGLHDRYTVNYSDITWMNDWREYNLIYVLFGVSCLSILGVGIYLASFTTALDTIYYVVQLIYHLSILMVAAILLLFLYFYIVYLLRDFRLLAGFMLLIHKVMVLVINLFLLFLYISNSPLYRFMDKNRATLPWFRSSWIEVMGYNIDLGLFLNMAVGIVLILSFLLLLLCILQSLVEFVWCLKVKENKTITPLLIEIASVAPIFLVFIYLPYIGLGLVDMNSISMFPLYIIIYYIAYFIGLGTLSLFYDAYESPSEYNAEKVKWLINKFLEYYAWI